MWVLLFPSVTLFILLEVESIFTGFCRHTEMNTVSVFTQYLQKATSVQGSNLKMKQVLLLYKTGDCCISIKSQPLITVLKL
jgi:hypothetical protein